MTSSDYLAVMVIVFLVLLSFAIHQWAVSPHYHRVSHRKLRALAARRGPAAGTGARSNAPAAGTHIPRASRIAARTGGSAGRADRGVESPSAPMNLAVPGADVEPQAVTTAGDVELFRRRPLPGGGLGPKTSVAAVVTPDSIAATGFQPQGEWGYAAASGPETGAAAGDVPMSQCIETRSVA